MDNIDQIKLYIEKEMTAAQKMQFEEQMNNNPALKEEVEMAWLIQQKMNRDMKARFKELNKANQSSTTQQQTSPLRKVENDQSKETQIPKIESKKSSSKIWLMAASLAGLLLISTFILLNMGGSGSSNLATNYLQESYPAPSLTMGTEQVEQKWVNAIRAYQAADFTKTANEIEGIVKTGSANAEHHFYLGLSYLFQDNNKAQNAISNFEKSLELNKSTYAQEIAWYTALANIQLGKKDLAKQQLQNIINNKHWKHKEATKLLKEI